MGSLELIEKATSTARAIRRVVEICDFPPPRPRGGQADPPRRRMKEKGRPSGADRFIGMARLRERPRGLGRLVRSGAPPRPAGGTSWGPAPSRPGTLPRLRSCRSPPLSQPRPARGGRPSSATSRGTYRAGMTTGTSGGTQQRVREPLGKSLRGAEFGDCEGRPIEWPRRT